MVQAICDDGIGRVVEAGVLDRLRDGEIGDARLDHRHAVVEIDLADAVELGHAEQHAVGQRQRAAGERGAGAARHHLDALARGSSAAPRRPARWSPAAPPPSAAGDRRSGRRTRRAASRARRRSRPRPARSRASAATIRSRRASTRCIGRGHCDRHGRAPLRAAGPTGLAGYVMFIAATPAEIALHRKKRTGAAAAEQNCPVGPLTLQARDAIRTAGTLAVSRRMRAGSRP